MNGDVFLFSSISMLIKRSLTNVSSLSKLEIPTVLPIVDDAPRREGFALTAS